MAYSYSISQVASITGGVLHSGSGHAASIMELLIDSRRLVDPVHTLFIALVSERNDGHRYIADLAGQGVLHFLVSRNDQELRTEFPACSFVKVKDTLTAMQQLAVFHRHQFSVPVIGITGSNGKTIVKEWLFQLLENEYNIVRSPKSYNSQIGVPLSVWKLHPDCNLAIFEAGISMPGEMEKLEGIIRPTIGIITNVGAAHDENFRDALQKATEKLRLFHHSGTLIYCRDHQVVYEAVMKASFLEQTEMMSWGHDRESDLVIRNIEMTVGHTTITGSFKEVNHSIRIPFTDDASVENAIHCWCCMLALGCSHEIIAAGMETLTPVAMRLELKEGINHCSLINDYYNSDLSSLSIALDFLRQQHQNPKKTVILSDILQSGRRQEDLYREIANVLESKGIDRLIGIGHEISRNEALFRLEKQCYESTDDFLQHFPFSSLINEAILLKGARVFEFERISQQLQQKTHETILDVNLDAIVHNLNYYRSQLQSGTKTMVMVKAFSYGSGSYEIASLLQFHRVDYLAVAYADEGVELRKSRINLPIMVMNPEEQGFELILKHDLEPEIYNFRMLNMLEEALRLGSDEEHPGVGIHLKIDTGMHRLGFEESDIEKLIGRLKTNGKIRIRSVFSHLAASEDSAEDGFTRTQISRLKAVSDRIRLEMGADFLVHIANSAAVTRFPEARFDMVRLGIGLYGVGFDAQEQEKLRNVSTLRTIISQIKMVKAGDTVGYSRRGKALRDTTIAIVPIGYADGLNRRLGNGLGKLLIAGEAAPIIGNICMDICMADITDAIKDRTIREGDPVVVFGEEYPVTRLAQDLGTIPYEILTGISRRVKRVYFHE